VTRRLRTIAGFYKYAVEEELLDHSPAAHVRRPRLDYESHATALDRDELGALLVAVGLGPPAEHALISLLALNGLRVSEATGADIEHLGLETHPPIIDKATWHAAQSAGAEHGTSRDTDDTTPVPACSPPARPTARRPAARHRRPHHPDRRPQSTDQETRHRPGRPDQGPGTDP
jgi:integrase